MEDLGEAAKQRDLLERALKIDEAYFGEDHKEVAITLTNLGNAYGDLGDAAIRKGASREGLEDPKRPTLARTTRTWRSLFTNLRERLWSSWRCSQTRGIFSRGP